MLKISYLLSVIKKLWKTDIYFVFMIINYWLFLFFPVQMRMYMYCKNFFFTLLFLKLSVVIFSVHLHLYIYRKYIQWSLSNPNPLWTRFCVRKIQVFSFYRLNLQRFPTLGLYFKCGLYRILFCSGFSLDRDHCIRIIVHCTWVFSFYMQ